MPPYLTTLLVLCATHWSGPVPQSITVRPQAVIAGDTVVLGDIADIAPPEAVAQAATIVVTPAPPVGCAGTLTRGYLRLRLRRAGLDPDAIALTGAESTRLTRPVPAATVAAPVASAGPATASSPALAAAGALPPVPRGTRLRLAVRFGGVTIETIAELLAPAVPGGFCRLRVPETQTVLDARLLSPSAAEVTR